MDGIFQDRCGAEGTEIDLAPPEVRPDPEKQWTTIEVQWEIGKTGEATVDLVESIISLTTWMFPLFQWYRSMIQ